MVGVPPAIFFVRYFFVFFCEIFFCNCFLGILSWSNRRIPIIRGLASLQRADWHLRLALTYTNRANFCSSHISSALKCPEKWQRNMRALSLPPAVFSPTGCGSFFSGSLKFGLPHIFSPELFYNLRWLRKFTDKRGKVEKWLPCHCCSSFWIYCTNDMLIYSKLPSPFTI